jgi:hypothetical protein
VLARNTSNRTAELNPSAQLVFDGILCPVPCAIAQKNKFNASKKSTPYLKTKNIIFIIS